MTLRFNRTLSAIVIVVMAVVFWPAPASSQSFWHGNNITDWLTEEETEALQTALVDAWGAIQGAWFSFGGEGTGEPIPTGVLVHDRTKTWDGYTLLSSLGGHLDEDTGITYGAILIDMAGNIIKEWPLVPYPARVLPGGNVIGGMGQFEEFTGVPNLVQLDWDGNEVWKWEGFDSTYDNAPYHSGVHHDYQREGSSVGYYAPGMEPMVTGGRTLILSHYIPPMDWTAHLTRHPLFDDALYEHDWEGNLTWEWHLWEYFDEMGFAPDALECIYENYVGRVPDTGSDYMHTNAASWLGPNKWYDQGDLRFHPDNIMIDCRSTNITMIIARHDHANGNWKSGDIVWKIGPNYTYGNPEYKLGQIIGQHQAHIIPKGLPGEGNVLMFDNGGIAGLGSLMPGLPPVVWNTLRDYSRILEFNPVTLEMVWEYACPRDKPDADGNAVEPAFSSRFVSGVQRLENGNTLVCSGQKARVFELTPDKKIVWDYKSPYGGGDTGMGFLGFDTLYRSERVPYSWVPIELGQLTTSSTSGGSVTSPGEETREYPTVYPVELAAVPDASYEFMGWEGPVADAASLTTTVVIEADTVVKALFRKVATYEDQSDSSDGQPDTYFLPPGVADDSIWRADNGKYYLGHTSDWGWTHEFGPAAETESINWATLTIEAFDVDAAEVHRIYGDGILLGQLDVRDGRWRSTTFDLGAEAQAELMDGAMDIWMDIGPEGTSLNVALGSSTLAVNYNAKIVD